MKKLIYIALIVCFSMISISAKQTIVKTPPEAAKGFYQAWSKKSRKTATKFAEKDAIDKLFGVNRHPLTFKGCTKNDEGNFECIYENKKLDLSFAMIVKSFRSGYRVTSISFSSEAI